VDLGLTLHSRLSHFSLRSIDVPTARAASRMEPEMTISRVSKTVAYSALASFSGVHYLAVGDALSGIVVAVSYALLLISEYTH
jgi:hypothetical protein